MINYLLLWSTLGPSSLYWYQGLYDVYVGMPTDSLACNVDVISIFVTACSYWISSVVVHLCSRPSPQCSPHQHGKRFTTYDRNYWKKRQKIQCKILKYDLGYAIQ